MAGLRPLYEDRRHLKRLPFQLRRMSCGVALLHGDVMNAHFFEANILGSEFFFFSKNDLHKLSRKQVDESVFLNDSNCYWQSMCSGEMEHRASFLTGECFRSHFWWALNFHQALFSGIVVLQHFDFSF